MMESEVKKRWAVAPFEHYMLCDESEVYPMTSFKRYWVKGHFNHESFELALMRAVKRHPMFNSRLDGELGWRTRDLAWVMNDEGHFPEVIWEKCDAPFETPLSEMKLDIRRGVACQFNMRETETHTFMILACHHATSDASGKFSLIEDLLAEYELIEGATESRRREIEPALLYGRDRFHLSWLGRLKRFSGDLWRTLTFFRALTLPLQKPMKVRGELTEKAEMFAALRGVIDVDTFSKYRKASKAKGVTVNDLLLRDLFLALHEWNKDQTGGEGNEAITLAIATSLRQPVDLKMSGANVVSMCFLERRRKVIDDADALLKSIYEETQDIKKRQIGITLPRVMGWLGRVPGLITKIMERPSCNSTAVLTNIGIPHQDCPIRDGAGRLGTQGVSVEWLESIGPVRHGTYLTISVNSYGGPLGISMRYASNVFSKEDAGVVMDLFLTKIKESVS